MHPCNLQTGERARVWGDGVPKNSFMCCPCTQAEVPYRSTWWFGERVLDMIRMIEIEVGPVHDVR